MLDGMKKITKSIDGEIYEFESEDAAYEFLKEKESEKDND